MASRRPSTRANPHRLPVTPVSDPEKIIKRGRDLQRQNSRAARGVSSRKILCVSCLLFIVVHVILSDNILRSYCLNDKNLTNTLI